MPLAFPVKASELHAICTIPLMPNCNTSKVRSANLFILTDSLKPRSGKGFQKQTETEKTKLMSDIIFQHEHHTRAILSIQLAQRHNFKNEFAK
jgi:hypothetical protein